MPEPEEPLDGALRRVAREIEEDDIDARLAWRAFANDVLGRDEPKVTIDRFEVRTRIGAGKFGRVYGAWDPRLKRTVAIKLHQRDAVTDDARAHFLREAKALARVSHENVVQVFGFGDSRYGLWFAMEHVDGTTLQAWQRGGQHGWREVVRAHLQLAEGIAATHAVEFVHGDVKPINAVVDASGRVFLVDFGLVGIERTPHRDSVDGVGEASTIECGGTPGYAAPEQVVQGIADAKSDQFSFCVGLYEALAGARPYTTDTIGKLGRGTITQASAYRPVPGAPRRIDRVLARGLAADPRERWADMGELVAALRKALGGRIQAAWIGGVALTLGVGLVVATSASPCERAATSVVDEADRERLRTALRDDGADAAAIADVLGALEADTQTWAATRMQVCEARGSDPIAFDRAMQCLRRVDDGRASLVETLSATPEARVRMEELRAAVVDPHDCLAGEASERDDPRAAAVLATIDHAKLELSAGRATEALALAQTAAMAAESAELGATLAEACFVEGRALDELARDGEARDRLLRAGELAEAHGLDALAPKIWFSLARLCATDLEQLADAERFAAQGDAATLRLGGSSSAEIDAAIARSEIATLHGAPGVSAAHLERVLPRIPLGSLRRLEIVERLAHLAALDGDFSRAHTLYTEVLAQRSRVLGPRNSNVLATRFNLARLAWAQGEWRRAKSELGELLADESAVQPGSVGTAATLVLLAQTEQMLGELEAARVHAEQAWELERTQLPPEHSERGNALIVLSAIHAARGDDAATLRVDLMRLAELDAVGSTRDLVPLSNNIGWLLCELGECERAGPYYDRVRRASGDPLSQVEARHGLARVALARGDTIEAQRGFEQALVEVAALDDAVAAHERAELELHLAELLATLEPGSPRIAALARRSAAAYAALGVRPDAARRARALAD